MLRQQTAKPDGAPNRCLADYVAPHAGNTAGDHLGGFAVAIHGADELAKKHEAAGDDYQAIMAKALADRLAEAFAEHTHLRARRALPRHPSGLRVPRVARPQPEARAVRPARRR